MSPEISLVINITPSIILRLFKLGNLICRNLYMYVGRLNSPLGLTSRKINDLYENHVGDKLSLLNIVQKASEWNLFWQYLYNCLYLIFFPNLNKGIINDSFHIFGKCPVLIDALNNNVSGSTNESAQNFKMQFGILSGPYGVVGFNLVK